MRKEIAAKFTSRCSACGSDIRPGETITYDPAIKYSSRHKVCPAVKQDPKPKVAKGAILNGPVIAQPQVARLSDEAAAEILAKIGSSFVHPLPTSEPTLGLGYKITIDGVEHQIGKGTKWVGQVTDHKGNQSWVVSLIDGAILDHLTAADAHDLKWMYAPLDKWAREMGAPLGRELKGKDSVHVGEIHPGKDGIWYIVVSVDKPYYMSAEAAEDMDMFDRGGGWATPYSVRQITEPVAEREKREAKARADREKADAIIAKLTAARDAAAALLPLGIRHLTSAEYAEIQQAIREKRAELLAENAKTEKLSPGVEKLVAAAKISERLPAMPGNENGYLAWEHIYRVGDRLVVDYCDTSYDGAGWMLQGIGVLPEDGALLADHASRAAIKGYRFDPALYAAMVAADAEGKLSKYGRGTYFGGTPAPCYDLPEGERACTKGAFAHERNQTAAEVRAELAQRFEAMANAEVVAILSREDSITEIRQ